MVPADLRHHPRHNAFKHIKARKAVEPVAKSPAEAQRLYNAVIA
jgi:hypothetical protein